MRCCAHRATGRGKAVGAGAQICTLISAPSQLPCHLGRFRSASEQVHERFLQLLRWGRERSVRGWHALGSGTGLTAAPRTKCHLAQCSVTSVWQCSFSSSLSQWARMPSYLFGEF